MGDQKRQKERYRESFGVLRVASILSGSLWNFSGATTKQYYDISSGILIAEEILYYVNLI